MKESKGNTELVNMILEDENDKVTEGEELLHMLLERKVSKNTNRVQDDNLTFGAKMADNIAKFAGSWAFIIIFIFCLVAWIVINKFLLTKPFDAYPFILLNLILSCIAAIQAPVILMSQNRQEEKDRLRAQNDYKTNLKSEIIVEDLHRKLDQMLINQQEILRKMEMLEKIPNDQK